MADLHIGDEVILLNVPAWLLKDLPEGEQKEILSFIGKVAQITEVDQYGYYWVGFGGTFTSDKEAIYSGHSFAVTADCLKSTGPHQGGEK